jgi:hypothetical protein
VKGKAVAPSLGVMGGDGTFYLCTYFGAGYGGKAPAVWRVKGDGKIEPYLHSRSNIGRDGPGLETGYFCGPHIWMERNDPRLIPPDCLYISTHDDSWLRRARDGRVSTLCYDGEWRELPRCQTDGVRWFRNFSPGPGGTAIVSAHNKVIKCLVSGIDYGKPVIGPLIAKGTLPTKPAKGKPADDEEKEEE